ncbi:hypothetical protein B0J11DRAFT_186878 [Dendryphion nanum]|uniref:Uncharacterized protein n=1 Tax=Dendryphion nanum TaxID=256645 RepID=A0A9P9IA37_9PLEO|nr:hypothetical protein B0J11DRAFT_186878 [Dendryphion nanum]
MALRCGREGGSCWGTLFRPSLPRGYLVPQRTEPTCCSSIRRRCMIRQPGLSFAQTEKSWTLTSAGAGGRVLGIVHVIGLSTSAISPEGDMNRQPQTRIHMIIGILLFHSLREFFGTCKDSFEECLDWSSNEIELKSRPLFDRLLKQRSQKVVR